ncbi:MAG: CDP-glucose 4,6-dehydratase [Nitrospina sp.]|nr:CDP-glucose 4,6-dehydratase [Nitrospina sp.]
MEPKFWKNKKVLITGHTGFKGSWLSLWLQKMEAELVGYSLPPPTSPNLFSLAKVADGMVSINGDIRDLDTFSKVVREYKPEIIIHMAAQSLVKYSHFNPVETYSTNVMGTVNVLESARHTDCVQIVLIVTSDKCYENKEWVWGYRENEPMGGYDPYSSSKGCAELVTLAYKKSYFKDGGSPFKNIGVASVRAGNVIAGGDWAKDRLIPDLIKAFIEKQPACIRNPNAIRPWQFVLEPINGYLTVVEKLWKDKFKYSGAWNFGPNEDDAKPVSWVVKQLATQWGADAKWGAVPTAYPHEANDLKLNCSKARSQLGWNPRLSLSSTLTWIVDWYKCYHDGKDIQEITQKQIADYQSIAKES